jgi:hypothetical protein
MRALTSTTSSKTWTKPDQAEKPARIIDGMADCIHIEITYKGRASLPCVYMEAAVQDVLPMYARRVTYSRVDIQSPAGKQRFLDLSCSLFGRKRVYEHHRLAPIPGLFMDGKLVFDAIPPRDELEAAIADRLCSEV